MKNLGGKTMTLLDIILYLKLSVSYIYRKKNCVYYLLNLGDENHLSCIRNSGNIF